MAVTVYTYGIPHWAPVPEVVDQQTRLAHDLREDLVTLEHERAERLAALWSSDPAIAELEQQILAAEAQVKRLGAQAAGERAREQRTGATASVHPLREAHLLLRTLRAARRKRITEVRALAETARQLAAITTEHRAKVKGLYAKYAQEPEPQERLYWATHNDVVAAHQRAVRRIEAQRSAGTRASLRHRRYRGAGSVAVQVMRDARRPPRTPATLASEQPSNPWRNVLQIHPWVDPDEWERLPGPERHRRRLGTVRLRCGPGLIELPVLVHRMLPADAEITGARLVVRQVGGHRRMALHVTARVADPPPARGPTIALYLGWRRQGDGVRVATWRGTEPVAVPPNLAQHVRAFGDRTGEIVLPPAWWERASAHERIQAERDNAIHKIREELVSWLEQVGPAPRESKADPEQPHQWVAAHRVATWHSPRRFARLAIAWRQWRPPLPGAEPMAEALEDWRRADRGLWEAQINGQHKARGARDEMYRTALAWLTELAGRLVVEDLSIARLARGPDATEDQEMPSAARAASAARRALAAPGRLREIAITAAAARGVQVVSVSRVGLTRTHYACGHTNPPTRYSESWLLTCSGCGRDYDQDNNATRVMLAASGDLPPAGPR